MFENRKWVILNIADYNDTQLQTFIDNATQSSMDTARKSIDGTKTFLKWDGDTPSCFNGMTTYNHSEILNILATDEWSDNTGII